MGTSNYSNIRNQKRTKFYSDSTCVNQPQNIQKSITDLSEIIKFNIKIKNIEDNCEYKIHLFNIENNNKVSLNDYFECKNIDKETTIFDRPIIIRYYFEKEQRLIIEITKSGSSISMKYEIKTTLGCIMGSRKNTWESKINPSGNEIIIIQAEKLKQSEDVLNIKFEINPEKIISFKDLRYKMYYEILSENILYRSECIDDFGHFMPVKIPFGLFKENKLTIKFYKSSRKERGNYTITINEFINGFQFKSRVNGTYFTFTSKSILTKNYSFVDYLNSGLEICLSVAIDFTASNGDPNYVNSLHSINSSEPNQYERAIRSCGNILSNYDYDQKYPCFGFGAKINNNISHVFNLNLEKDPNVQFIDGIISAYHKALNSVQLYGPTFFEPIIKEINTIIKEENDETKYHILMILTDGIIDDVDNTIDELVEASNLRLSIIIIGVGKADFTNMNTLDADENPLVNSRGIKASRDLVQFVPFLKYESKSEQLANEVLAEIPRQIIEYYEQKNINPQKLASMKMN